MNEKISAYNNSIDFFKGTLIISVFLGHLIIGNINDTFVRYFIYSFHMPLFIGISGYLFNYNSLNESPKNFIKKLFRKIIVPYISAIAFYCSFISYKFILDCNISLFIINFFKNVIYSYYHLWYIQGYLSYIIITYFVLKLDLNMKKIIILSFGFSLIIYYLYFIADVTNIILKIFLRNFQLYFFIFFIIGYFLKEKKIDIKLNNRNWIIVISLFILNSILGFYIKNQYIVGLFFYLSNIFSVIFMLKICKEYSNFKINSINFMGSHSLYFYLWHILPIIILKSRILNENIYSYYILGIISFYGLYILLKKIFLKRGIKNV